MPANHFQSTNVSLLPGGICLGSYGSSLQLRSKIMAYKKPCHTFKRENKLVLLSIDVLAFHIA